MSDQKHEYPDLLGEALSNQNFAQSPQDYIRSLPGRNWNDEFQKLIEKSFDDTEAETIRAKQIRKLSKEFAETANQIGTTIISELFLPSSQKSIFPMTSWVGGIAGGEKYVREGIFFKFALDEKGIYGGDEHMMKSGGHEFKSLMELIDCRINGLHYPFIVIVDYRGFRLIAESVLPLGPDSIIYGSSDGSKTIHADNIELNKRLEKAGQILNLAPHTVWNWDKTAKTTLYMPVDVEGHLGLDNRFYVIDTARLFPPSTPQKGIKGCHLYRLLRPELVKNNPVPLCPDAYSRFLVENRESFDADIDAATNRLYQKIIPEFVEELNQYYTKNAIFPDIDMTDELSRVVAEAHRKGINIRCFGEIRRQVSDDILHLKELIMTEIVTRVIKNIMRAHMRKLETPQESRYKKLLLTYFNLMFGSTTKSTEFWKLYLKDRINSAFTGGLTKDEMDPNYNLRRTVLTRSLFIRLQKLIGAKFEDSAMDKFKIMEGGLMLLTKDLNEKDLDKIYPIVKYTNRMAFEEGTVLSKKAAKETKGEADEYFKQAQQKYKDALEIKPDDYRALHNWALSLTIQASRKKGQEAESLYESAIEKLKQALTINKADARAHLLWGNMLLEQSSKTSDLRQSSQLLVESSDHYQTSFKLDPKQFDLLYNWGNALLYRGKIENDLSLYEQALEKYAAAVELKKQSVNALRNWAVCMAKYARCLYAKGKSNFSLADRNYELAGQKFDACLKLKPNDRGVLFNWGNALYRQARMYEFEKNNEMANKLYGLASEKYLTAMNIKANSLDALYNWGKVLQSQACIDGDYATSQDFVFAVTYYLEVFKNVAIKFGEVKLDPILAMTRLDNKVVQLKAFSFLKWLCANKINTRLQLEASKAVKNLLESKNNVWLAFSSTDSQTELPSLVAQLLQTLGSSELEEGEGVTLTLDSFHIISELEPGDHKLGQMFKVCREESSELFILRTIECQSLYRRIGIQEDVNPDHVIQYITVADEKNDIKRSYFNHLRGSIPFYASLAYILRTEDSDYALIYKMKFNPFMLVNYFHPKIAIPATEMKSSDPNINNNNNVNNNSNVNNNNDSSMLIKKKKKISKSISTDNKRKEFDLLFFACEILTALEDLHNKDMIYGDMKVSEIFIDKEGHACLYKLPFTIYSEIKSTDIYPEYTAPEIITGKNHKMETDWYCYGIMLYELYTGKSPFYSNSPHKIYDKVLSAVVEWPHDMSDSLKSLIQSLIMKDRSKRLKDVAEIKNHPFFKAINWKTVQERDLDPPFIPQNFESDTFEAVPTLVAQYKKGKFHGFTFVAVD